MGAEPCIHEMAPGTCSICQERAAARANPRHPLADGPRFRRGGGLTAQFESTCSECRQPIDVGDPIAESPSGYYVHLECS